MKNSRYLILGLFIFLATCLTIPVNGQAAFSGVSATSTILNNATSEERYVKQKTEMSI